MKELTIEQKAKAYDEALKVLHKYDGANIMFSQSLKEEMFPELKESEDDKTRSEIIRFIQMEVEDEIVGNKWLAWLEKQSETDETKAKIFLINKGYPIDTNGTFPTYEKMYNIIREGEKTSLQANERAWLHLVSDVLTWKDGIGQYLDDPRVQELAKKLCSEYTQKLYN